ncbi:MAG: YncE family protein [Acidobacteria bacterium]|nr:YncE family protein [Acidobacteriota bacterium]
MRRIILFLVAGLLLGQTASDYKVQTRYPVAGEGRWDYITLDSQARRLYLSHGPQADVIDADTGKPVGKVEGTPGIHGVALAAKFKRGFTSNGAENMVSVFDSETLALIKKVPVGKGPDAIYYDEGSGRVFVTNHGSHDVTVIDAKTGDVAGVIDLKGDGEAMATGPDGMVYIPVEDTSEVARVNPKTLEITARFPIAGCQTPTGFAMDNRTHRIFIGCRSKVAAVMNSDTGKVIATLPIGTGVDAAAFDPKSKLAFFSNGEGNISVIRQKSADVYEAAGTIPTQQGAKTMAFDPKTGKLFLPTAEMEPVPGQRGRVKPGTFRVLVVGR